MKKCFVISPIGADDSDTRKIADETLEFVIEPACNAKGYDVTRSDKISDNGMITQSIIENLLQSDIAIADLSDKNPNVFYELAVRHAYGLPVIQITRDALDKIPFDVHNVRTIQYDLSASGAKKASEEIEKVIESIENGNKTLNPITSVSSILNISPNSSSEKDEVLSELLLRVNSIPERLDVLENNIGVRFSQMLTAFSESLSGKTTPATTEDDIKNRFLENLMQTLMDDPQKGMAQMNNLLSVQKQMEKINNNNENNND